MTTNERRRRIGNYLVAAQFGLILVCMVPVGPVLAPVAGAGLGRTLGLACMVLALVVGALALHALGSDTRVHPVPDESARLHTNGIYAFIRHPMYAAVLLACLGVTLSSGRVLSLLALVALAVVLHVKSRFEDRLLELKFGWQFAVYASRVPAIVPQPWRSHRR